MHSLSTTAPKSKTLATWAALLGGPMGLHRFYLYGFDDLWGWLHPAPTLIGAWGLHRAMVLGLDDTLSWTLMPVLGLMVSYAMLQAIVYGLTPDLRWNQRHNPQWVGRPEAPTSGWAAIIGVVLALLLGATVLMSTIAFSGQRYFEYQVQEGLKISQ